MIAPTDFYVNISIHVTDEVIRMVCLTIGFIVAVWGMVKMARILLRKEDANTART